MNHWRPSLSEFAAPFKQARPWNDPLERLGKGIDNAHVDVLLSPRLRERIGDTVRKLILEEVRAHGVQTSPQSVSAQDLDAFREAYLAQYQATLERVPAQAAPARLALLQLSLLKCLLEAVARENLHLQEELKGGAAHPDSGADSSLSMAVHDDLVVLTRDRHAINRRVLSLLLRQVKDLERRRLATLRAAVAGNAWPFPEGAFFNPVLSIPNLDEVRALAMDYPIAWLARNGDTGWLFQTNQCISKVFQLYLPPWTQVPSDGLSAGDGPGLRERRDQGLLKGFLETEILLSRFVSAEEYRFGHASWLDEPENLRLFLGSGAAPAASELPQTDPAHWHRPGWSDFQRAIVSELHRCLDLQGLTRRIALIYRLPAIRSQLGRPVPFSLALDFMEGRLPRRRLAERIDGLRLGLDPVTTARVLQRTVTDLKHLPPQGWARYLNRYLVDFLVLRRDLKLAYKTFEAMDGIRLIDEPNEVRLSRSNASLQEFPCSDEREPSLRRIRAHAVIKADLRGSTGITETLRARGLNPASHFSLNFFEPVNKLLPEYGAEKLFVEGDAVILAIFELDGAGPATTVAQACVLARKILQVVDLQNARNRKHGLPELELGLGVSFSPREPNFLYDDGRRIMISEAINRADRLSACDTRLRHCGFTPGHDAFRVAEVRDASDGVERPGDDLLSYNVGGVKIDQAAFLKVQKEIRLHQVRLPDVEAGDNLLLGGSFRDLAGRKHWLVVRYGQVREWDGQRLGDADPERRHFFEVVVDQSLAARLRKVPS